MILLLGVLFYLGLSLILMLLPGVKLIGNNRDKSHALSRPDTCYTVSVITAVKHWFDQNTRRVFRLYLFL